MTVRPGPSWWATHVLLRLRTDRTERGDVPGWVLITVMSAGVVAVLFGVARGQLPGLFESAINSVK